MRVTHEAMHQHESGCVLRTHPLQIVRPMSIDVSVMRNTRARQTPVKVGNVRDISG
jgi:hypothetical protein